jgi:hypothetical protein
MQTHQNQTADSDKLSAAQEAHQPLHIDIRLLAQAQTVTTGANVHQLNQLICIYTLGCNVFNRAMRMAKIPDYAHSLRKRASEAETELRRLVHQLEYNRNLSQLRTLTQQNPRLEYFTALLGSKHTTVDLTRARL